MIWTIKVLLSVFLIGSLFCDASDTPEVQKFEDTRYERFAQVIPGNAKSFNERGNDNHKFNDFNEFDTDGERNLERNDGRKEQRKSQSSSPINSRGLFQSRTPAPLTGSNEDFYDSDSFKIGKFTFDKEKLSAKYKKRRSFVVPLLVIITSALILTWYLTRIPPAPAPVIIPDPPKPEPTLLQQILKPFQKAWLWITGPAATKVDV